MPRHYELSVGEIASYLALHIRDSLDAFYHVIHSLPVFGLIVYLLFYHLEKLVLLFFELPDLIFHLGYLTFQLIALTAKVCEPYPAFGVFHALLGKAHRGVLADL